MCLKRNNPLWQSHRETSVSPPSKEKEDHRQRIHAYLPCAICCSGRGKWKKGKHVCGALETHRRKWGLRHVKMYKRLRAQASLIVYISVSVSESFSGRSDKIKTVIDRENYGPSPSIITLSVVSTCKNWIQPLCAPHSYIYSVMPAREPMLVSSLNYWRISHDREKE